jgi:hypothetical protein
MGLSSGVLLSVLALSSGLQWKPLEINSQILVRVHDTARIGAEARDRALKAAGEILAAAGIPVRWHICDRIGLELPASCLQPLRLGERVIQLVRSQVLEPSPGWIPLGEAFIDRTTRTGVLAKIYADRVQAMARKVRFSPDVLFGRAIAHELGHLLLGNPQHSKQGLMRSEWSQREIMRDWPPDWRFSAEETANLRASLAVAVGHDRTTALREQR